MLNAGDLLQNVFSPQEYFGLSQVPKWEISYQKSRQRRHLGNKCNEKSPSCKKYFHYNQNAKWKLCAVSFPASWIKIKKNKKNQKTHTENNKKKPVGCLWNFRIETQRSRTRSSGRPHSDPDPQTPRPRPEALQVLAIPFSTKVRVQQAEKSEASKRKGQRKPRSEWGGGGENLQQFTRYQQLRLLWQFHMSGKDF